MHAGTQLATKTERDSNHHWKSQLRPCSSSKVIAQSSFPTSKTARYDIAEISLSGGLLLDDYRGPDFFQDALKFLAANRTSRTRGGGTELIERGGKLTIRRFRLLSGTWQERPEGPAEGVQRLLCRPGREGRAAGDPVQDPECESAEGMLSFSTPFICYSSH